VHIRLLLGLLDPTDGRAEVIGIDDCMRVLPPGTLARVAVSAAASAAYGARSAAWSGALLLTGATPCCARWCKRANNIR
jgi:hypothetical protein